MRTPQRTKMPLVVPGKFRPAQNGSSASCSGSRGSNGGGDGRRGVSAGGHQRGQQDHLDDQLAVRFVDGRRQLESRCRLIHPCLYCCSWLFLSRPPTWLPTSAHTRAGWWSGESAIAPSGWRAVHLLRICDRAPHPVIARTSYMPPSPPRSPSNPRDGRCRIALPTRAASLPAFFDWALYREIWTSLSLSLSPSPSPVPSWLVLT